MRRVSSSPLLLLLENTSHSTKLEAFSAGASLNSADLQIDV